MNIYRKSIKINIKNNISWKIALNATKEITSFLLNKIKQKNLEKNRPPPWPPCPHACSSKRCCFPDWENNNDQAHSCPRG